MIKTIAIEELRYRLHQEYLKETYVTEMKSILSTPAYWEEIGVFVSITPRRSGKTDLIQKLIKELLQDNEQIIFLTPYRSHQLSRTYQYNTNIQIYPFNILSIKPLNGYIYNQYHLFIDNYQFLAQKYLQDLFQHQWKAINLFGSFKVFKKML